MNRLLLKKSSITLHFDKCLKIHYVRNELSQLCSFNIHDSLTYLFNMHIYYCIACGMHIYVLLFHRADIYEKLRSNQLLKLITIMSNENRRN